MAFSPQVYGIISQIGDNLYQRQKPTKEKANTVTTGIGTAISALLGAGTYLLQSGIDGLPSWLPIVVMLLGMLGTVFGVNRTRNGVTRSVLDDINREISRLIDEQEGPTVDRTPGPTPPTTSPDTSTPAPGRLDGIADTLDGIAKRLGNRQG